MALCRIATFSCAYWIPRERKIVTRLSRKSLRFWRGRSRPIKDSITPRSAIRGLSWAVVVWSSMIVDITIIAAKAFLVLFMVLNLAGILGWIERKGSALIQDRIGANRASILGFAGMGLVNTLIADPVKFLTKEDVVPAGSDRVLHFLAPVLSLVPVLVTFAVVPFGDVLEVGSRTIDLQAAPLNAGVLYVLAMASVAVYGVVLAGWSSNNRWSLLG